MSTEPRELLSAINQGLPNIGSYIRVILSHEKLSEEAESWRCRYDSILTALEQGHQLPRPVSLVGDGDSGYFSVNRSRGVPSGDPSEQLVGFPSVSHSGILLRRDDKFRWHRCWCKVDSGRMKFFIYEDNSEEVLVHSFSLESTNVLFNPTLEDYDKENCFVITGITSVEVEGGDAPSEEVYFAAYCEGEFDQWKSALKLLVSSRESARISVPSLDRSSWGIQTGQDSASTSSSNFSSNRDSMISTTSSLLTSYRNSGRADSQAPEREQVGAEDVKTLSLAKQQQPLPSPPNADTPKEVEEDGNASEGTIYESIDNLVVQFDETMKATARAMGQVGQNMKSRRKHKKKERTLTRQHSFFSSKSKSHKAKLVSQKKAELEKGEHYSGYLYKRSSGGTWKKKWCCLKGCILSYYKAPDQTEGNEYVVLDATIHVIQESKKQFAFGLQCKGIAEMFFAADDEEQFLEWLSRLDAASKETGDLGGNWEMWLQDEDVQSESMIPQGAGDTAVITEGIYNVPRVAADTKMYPQRGLPPMQASVMSAQAAIDSGLYSVPHSLLAAQHPQPYLSGNPYDLYDVPRPLSMSPDEGEAIYDDPFDIIDMEIYDYPPDAIDAYNATVLGPSVTDSARSSTVLSGDFASTDQASSAVSDDTWKTMTLPPLPTSVRPSMAFSTVSSEEYDYQQSARSSTASMDGVYDYPRSIPVDPFLSSIIEKPSDNTVDADIHVPVSALEYGDCTMRGVLYKRERLKQWNKLSCVIRNSFLQCHKAQDPAHSGTPVLKLFLPGSEISTEVESRRPWAFQVRHPRRGNLVFAAEREPEYYQWVRAFRSATSIEVQAVSTVDEIRLTDIDLQRRWSSMEKDMFPGEDELSRDSSVVDEYKRERAGSSSRRKTFPEGTADDYQSDTLKRKRKFSWVKSNFMRKKGDKKSPSDSTASHRLSNISFDTQVNSPILSTNPTRRSVSLEMLPAEDEVPTPTPVNAQTFSQSQGCISPIGSENFQGFLRVQRKGAESMWVRYWCVVEDGIIGCYISQQDHTLTLSIQLEGSRIAKASYECRREHTFKVWHVESGQCLYFAADSRNEFDKWLKEITKGAELIIPEGAPSHFAVAFYYHHKDTASGDNPSPSQASSRSSNMSLTPSPEDGDVSLSSGATGESQDSIYQRGDLKKLSQSGKWKDRYCLVKDSTLYVYHSSSEKTPVTAITLTGCSVELLNTTAEETQRYSFQIVSASGKVHTLATTSELELSAWVSKLQDCCRSKHIREDLSSKPSSQPSENGAVGESHSNSPLLFRHGSRSSHTRRHGKTRPKSTDIVSYVPANELKDSVYSGFADLQFGTAPRARYWCVLHSDCLYIYQNQKSQSTVKTIVLPGYKVQAADHNVEDEFAIMLTHPGVSPVCLTVSDHSSMTLWLEVLDQGARAESHGQYKGESRCFSEEKLKVLSQKASSRTAASKKGPIKGDHTVLKLKDEYCTGSEVTMVSSQKSSHELKLLHDSIVRRYEKRIRKTHKIANLTDQNLKQQQTALGHLKKELSRHVSKLQELADSGDTHAQKRLKDIRTKMQQVDKILPYLAKYIAVNRQAELQTVAVLKESCTVECQQLRSVRDSHKFDEHYYSNESDAASKVESNEVPPSDVTSSPMEATPEECVDSILSTRALENKETGKVLPTPIDQQTEESPYASLSSIRPQATTAPSSNYAQLEFSQVGGPSVLRPPSVNYAQVDIDSLKGVVVISNPSKTSINASVESESSTTAGSQLPNSSNEQLTILPSNRSVNQQVCNESNIMSSEAVTTVEPGPLNEDACVAHEIKRNSLDTKLEEPILSDDGSTIAYMSNSNCDPHIATPANEPKASSVLAAVKQFESSKKVKSFSAPSVAKKPSRKSSLAGSDISSGSSLDLMGDPLLDSGLRETRTIRDSPRSESRESTPTLDSNWSKDVQSLTEGTPSVLERIRALQQKKSL